VVETLWKLPAEYGNPNSKFSTKFFAAYFSPEERASPVPAAIPTCAGGGTRIARIVV
jgi:hypothetical protein